MALAKKTSNSTRIVVIAAVVIAVAGIGFVLFKQFFLQADTTLNLSNSAAQKSTAITEFGESILNDPRFTGLQSFDTTVNADANRDGGQANPFR